MNLLSSKAKTQSRIRSSLIDHFNKLDQSANFNIHDLVLPVAMAIDLKDSENSVFGYYEYMKIISKLSQIQSSD
ncbi:MAG: hypothetical protein WA160_06415 [Pseudobdellovibrio sp.]